jgi:hypothetical protein
MTTSAPTESPRIKVMVVMAEAMVVVLEVVMVAVMVVAVVGPMILTCPRL